MNPPLTRLPAPPGRVLKLRLDRSLAEVIRRGHPWLYAREGIDVKEAGPSGSLVTLYDEKNRFLAAGLYDPAGAIRVRVFQRGKPAPIDESLFAGRIRQAGHRRASLAATLTTGYRVVHGENDDLPGAVVDRYDTTYVLKLYTTAWVPHLPALVSALARELAPEHLVLRLPRTVARRTEELHGLTDGQLLLGEPFEGPVPFEENGLRFMADVWKGQKTGFFLDQRDNRQRVRARAAGRTALNVCCYSGGFSVYAAAGGSPLTVNLDISGHALRATRENFARNPSLASTAVEYIRGDAFDELPALAQSPRRFGLVIVDPPSFAMREADRDGALVSYRVLNARAVKLLAPGGLLVTCSCSAHVDVGAFEATVRQALGRRRFTIVDRTGHGLDHPVTFPEGRYLKTLWIQL